MKVYSIVSKDCYSLKLNLTLFSGWYHLSFCVIFLYHDFILGDALVLLVSS